MPEVYYLCDPDGGCDDERIEVNNLDEAIKLAEEWIDGGDWDTSHGTTWPSCDIRQKDEDGDLETVETVEKAVHPPEPECEEADEHEWTATHAIEGGLKENPGVFGHGGGVKIHSHCRLCGQYRIQDTWAQDSATGKQGLESVEYPDEKVELGDGQ